MVSCRILINKPIGGVFKSGQLVTGTVMYALDKPTEYKYIVLSLVGKGKCTWTEQRSKRTIRYTGTEEYVSQRIDVFNAKDASVTLPAGPYEFPFQFLLPENIPPSFSDRKCDITYKVKMTFVKPTIFSSSKRFYTEITVASYFHPTTSEGPRPFGLEKLLFRPFSSRKHTINLRAELDKTVVTPGNNANVAYILTNDTDITIKSVVTGLVCKTTYIADCGKAKRITKTITESVSESPSIPNDGIANLSAPVPIPSDLASVNTKIMVREFILTACVRLPLPYINAQVEIPVLVGEQKSTEVQSDYGNDPLHNDQPPSYWEVMSEDKETEADSKSSDGLL